MDVMKFEDAIAFLRPTMPPSPPWVFYNLARTVTPYTEPPVTWSVEWTHAESGATGSCEADTLEQLALQISEAVRHHDEFVQPERWEPVRFYATGRPDWRLRWLRDLRKSPLETDPT